MGLPCPYTLTPLKKKNSMALVPLTAAFRGDFVVLLVIKDTDTMNVVAQKVALQSNIAELLAKVWKQFWIIPLSFHK